MIILRWAFRVLLLVVLLIAAFFAYLVFFFDTESLKPEIEQLTLEQTGLNLHLNGKINWSIYPHLGFVAHDVVLKDERDSATLVSSGKALAKVALMPLFQRKIEARSVYLNQLNINYHVDAKGESFVSRVMQRTAKPAKKAEPNKKSQLSVARLPDIRVTNAQLSYKDARSHKNYTVTIDKFKTTPIRFGAPFGVEMAVGFNDHEGIESQLSGQYDVLINKAKNIFELSDVDMRGKLAGQHPLQLDLRTAQLVYNQPQGTLSFQPITLLFDDVEAVLDGKVEGLNQTPRFNGALKTNNFNVKKLMQSFNQSVAMNNKHALSNVAFATDIAGSAAAITLDNMAIQLDDSQVSGKMRVDLNSQAINFDINLDRLNLDDYLPPASAAQKDSTQASDWDAELLPVDLLRKLMVQGAVSVDKLSAFKQDYTQLHCGFNARSGDITVHNCAVNTLDGNVKVNARIDARKAVPTVRIETDVTQLNVGQMVKMATNKSPLTGLLNSAVSLNVSGNSMNSWLSSSNGAVQVDLLEGLLKGINLRNVVADNMGEDLTQLLEMGLAKKGWSIPKTLDKDTHFRDIKAPVVIKNGVLYTDNIAATLKSGDVLKGKGQYSVITKDFDYRFTLTIPRLSKNPELNAIEWPIRCNGNVSGSPKSWCNLDKSGVQSLAKNFAKQKAENAARNFIADKLGIQLDENQSVIDAAQQEAERRAAEEIAQQKQRLVDKQAELKAEAERKLAREKQRIEDQAKAKLKKELGDAVGEEVNKQVGDALKGLFGG